MNSPVLTWSFSAQLSFECLSVGHTVPSRIADALEMLMRKRGVIPAGSRAIRAIISHPRTDPATKVQDG